MKFSNWNDESEIKDSAKSKLLEDYCKQNRLEEIYKALSKTLSLEREGRKKIKTYFKNLDNILMTMKLKRPMIVF